MAVFAAVSYENTTLGGQPAGEKLRQLAALASTQPTSGEGPIQHVALDSWFLTQDGQHHAALVPTIIDKYFLRGGTVRSIGYSGDPINAAGRITSTRAVSRIITDETLPGPEQGPGYADALPSGSEALIRKLIPDLRECPLLAQCLTSQILDLNYSWVVPPPVVATLWEALAAQSGVSYLGETVDRLDRRSVAFAVTTYDRTTKIVLYVDPATGLLLGSDEVLLKDDSAAPDAPALNLPAVRSFMSLVESRRVEPSDIPSAN
jgi:hypothetical protein